MPRLFYGNFDFEETLAAPDRQQSRVVQRILAELATTWMALAQTGDVLWCPQAIEANFFDRLFEAGFPRVKAVSDLNEIPAGCDFVPWGWTAEAIDWAGQVEAITNPPPLDAVRAVNSRRFAWEQECARGLQLPGSRLVTGWEDLVDAVEMLWSLSMRWVIKSEFSQSGRDRYCLDRLDRGHRNEMESWARPRLEAGRPLFVEPWLDAREEVGIQLTVQRDGSVQCEGITGTWYRSGAFAVGNFSLTPYEEQQWSEAVSIALEVGQAAADCGYFGPLGIDAMRYRDLDGTMRVRAIQDVNARWTMGRLSLGHRHLLQTGEQGRWLMGQSVDDLESAETVPFPQRRIIDTSPHQIAGRPVRLRSCVVIDRSS